MSGEFRVGSRSPRKGAAVFGLLFAAVLGLGSPVCAFAAERWIETEGLRRTDAVAITRVAIGSSDVQCGRMISPTETEFVMPIEAGDDWIQNLTVSLFNRTNQLIVFAQVDLRFPETGDGTPERPMRGYTVSLGRMPASVAFSGSTGKPIPQDPKVQPLALGPGQTLVIRLADYLDRIEGSVDNMPFTSVTRLIIRRGIFYFHDGMRWYGVQYSAPDPQHPGRFTDLDGNYFPGNMRMHWPPGFDR